MNKDVRELPTVRIEVPLTDEEHAAVQGWRQANGLGSTESAARQLIRLGLLSEIGRIYQVSAKGDEPE